MKVTVSHPHGSLFSYHAARALSEKGWLQSFQAGVVNGNYVSKLGQFLPGNAQQRLLNRSFEHIPEQNRHAHFIWEAISRLGKRIKPTGLTSRTNWYDVLFSGHDWHVSQTLEKEIDAVYTYEDGAKLTFEAVKQRSIAKVYELPLGYYLGVAHEMERAVKTTLDIKFQIKQEPAWKRARKDVELELADLVIVPCEWARESLNYSKLQKKHVVKVPYGTPADEISVRAKKPDGSFTVLFAGQVGVRKGVPILIKAWERLRLGNARLLMAGSMNLDEKYLNDHNNSQYLGALPRVRLLELIKEADLFVFPSLADGFGMVIGEAMAAGVPVLTTMNTGGPELITNGREGWCVPAHDVNSLAERIEWAYQHRDALYEMGMLARRRAEQWTWADYRRKLVGELSKYLGTHIN